MDSALELRMGVDAGRAMDDAYIDTCLAGSHLIERLTLESPKTILAMVWRLIALSEIPYSYRLDFTKELVQGVTLRMYSGEVFSLEGETDLVLPCYHAMVIRALLRLGVDHPGIDRGIEWTLTYQPLDRSTPSCWNGSASKKYGGCFKSVPCYIGLVKSLKTLSTANKLRPNPKIQKAVSQGLRTVLNHRLIFRLSQPESTITKHMLDLAFPENYHLNILELLQLCRENDCLDDPRTLAAREFLAKKRTPQGYWKINFIYKAQGYLPFDVRGQQADWFSYLAQQVVDHV